MEIEERHFVNKKIIKFTIDDFEIYIFRRDSNGVFEITIHSNNETSIDFTRRLHDIKKEEYIREDYIKKPLDDYTYENVKNNLMFALKTKEEKAKYIDDLFERYLEWYQAKKLIDERWKNEWWT